MTGRTMPACVGAAYVEFLVVVLPLLLLFFGLTQLGLVYGAQLMVEHAASKAARAAVVILPDDHEEADYGGVPVNRIGVAGEGAIAYMNAPSGGRLAAVRDAARFVLAPVAPSLEGLGGDSVASAIGSGGLGDSIVGFLGWNEWATSVTFPDGEGGYKTGFDARGPVTVEVTFLFKCSVPVARSVMCSGFGDLPKERKRALALNGKLLGVISGVSGWKVIALSARRTLPNQGR